MEEPILNGQLFSVSQNSINEADFEIFLICQGFLADRNRVRFNRISFFCNTYPVHVLGRGPMAGEVLVNAASVASCPKLLPNCFFPIWVLWRVSRIRCHGGRKKKIVYTTYEPFNLLAGYLLQLLGFRWIADIFDDPEKSLMIAKSVEKTPGDKLVTFAKKIEFAITKRILKKTDFCITLIKPELVKKYFVPKEKIYSITNGVNLDIDYSSYNKEKNDIFTINYVGPIEKTRIRSLPPLILRLAERIKNFQIFLIGPDIKGGMAWLNKELASIRDGVIINITGRLPHEEVLKIISRSDVSLCLYPNDGDLNPAYPIKIFEAMAVGLPVIASRLRGISEIITDSEDGFLVNPEDIEEAVNTIVMLKDNVSLRNTIGKNAKEKVKKFDWQLIHNGLKEEIDHFLSKAWAIDNNT